jgi:hypothetical protein
VFDGPPVPGLLLSFAARLDAAKALVGIASGGSNNASFSSSQTCPESVNRWWCAWMSRCCGGGYFPPLVVAYAIGLLMANIAVYVMEMGQPALLYLVPCTLGTMTFMGWRRKELRSLWEGPRLIASADIIVYGRTTSSNGPTPTDTGAAVTMTPTGNSGGSTSDSGNDHQTEEGLTRMDEEEDAGGVPLLSTNATK